MCIGVGRSFRFHGLRHPRDMGGAEVEAYLTHLAADRGMAPSSHRQALSALLFLYGQVLGLHLPWMKDIGRPVPKRRLPVVLSAAEVLSVLQEMAGEHQLLARLLYGTGMRISEGLGLRIKDLDFAQGAIYVRHGKGGKDRVVMLPSSLALALRDQLARVRAIWWADVEAGQAGVELPYALERKYPRAGSSWAWFWLFPQDRLSIDPRSGVIRRHHLYAETFQRAFKRRWLPRASASRRRLTPCGTASPPTCCRPAMTSAPCKSCWGTRMWPPP